MFRVRDERLSKASQFMEILLTLLIKSGIALGVMLTIVPNLVWMERKVSARIQRRVGPNRMGPAGLLQTAMDGIKLLFKEQFRPDGADRWIYLAAPIITFLPGLIAFGLIPMGVFVAADGSATPIVVANIDLAIIVIFAISSVASYGVAYAGWSSGNQYAMLGGIRACAQLVSYEIVLGLAVVATVMMTGSLNLVDIVQSQTGWLAGASWLPAWNLFLQPFTFVLFLIAGFAETNRAPFDLAEAEQELVGGYHTEYSGIRFGWFMFGEYAALWTMCSMIVAIFLGGWTLPGVALPAGVLGAVLGVAIHCAKVILLIFFFMWVRWTMPRVRWDQLMGLGWNKLIPLGVANIFLTILIIEWFSPGSD
ncbi:MAG: NADH-quinone oxidoreductase subunit NuoH [Leptospirales bacterium]